MKLQHISTTRFFTGLIVLYAVVVSGCGSLGDSTATGNVAVADKARNVSYPSTANTSAMAADMSPESGTDGERYAEIDENPFLRTDRAPLSTFSIDVDTASYANVRRYINDGALPPKNAVRIEELINYFDYDHPQPIGDVPFSVNTELAACPWNSENYLLQIGLKGKQMQVDTAPAANLVFLLDVSGSMNSPDKLPLLKSGLRMMVDQLKPTDRVAIAVYAGSSGLVLPSTPVSDRGEILAALNSLEAGGSTNGGQGIELAYTVAANNFIQGGNNRVILATDGDFNVGTTSDDALVRLIEEKRKTGIFLSVLGFGKGNLNDSMMEKLSNKGNGNYAYIDSREEARKALGEQVAGTLNTIAKDVKIQVEFNPALVSGYRLIGYENRLLADRDFDDDAKDAGEIGAGHTVTALYEIVPAGKTVDNKGIELKYSEPAAPGGKFTDELATVKLRYKDPEGSTSKLLSMGVQGTVKPLDSASADLRFAAAVAQFGLVLRDSRYKGAATLDAARQLAVTAGQGGDQRRQEFLDLITKAAKLKRAS